MSEIIYNSNKAMIAYLIKNGCRVLDVRLGYNDTILFGFDKAETNILAKNWFGEIKSNRGPLKSKFLNTEVHLS